MSAHYLFQTTAGREPGFKEVKKKISHSETWLIMMAFSDFAVRAEAQKCLLNEIILRPLIILNPDWLSRADYFFYNHTPLT